MIFSIGYDQILLLHSGRPLGHQKQMFTVLKRLDDWKRHKSDSSCQTNYER
uniref:Uncharacterized protein n=1 Tax=Octopus bimaculoides TaxID=37653 RepID=A0A0L8GLB1_OCTBM